MMKLSKTLKRSKKRSRLKRTWDDEDEDDEEEEWEDEEEEDD